LPTPKRRSTPIKAETGDPETCPYSSLVVGGAAAFAVILVENGLSAFERRLAKAAVI